MFTDHKFATLFSVEMVVGIFKDRLQLRPELLHRKRKKWTDVGEWDNVGEPALNMENEMRSRDTTLVASSQRDTL